MNNDQRPPTGALQTFVLAFLFLCLTALALAFRDAEVLAMIARGEVVASSQYHQKAVLCGQLPSCLRVADAWLGVTIESALIEASRLLDLLPDRYKHELLSLPAKEGYLIIVSVALTRMLGLLPILIAACIAYRSFVLRVALMVAAFMRVRPETLCRITEFSEHESNGRELDEGERVAVEVLPVLGQSAAAVEPGDGAFDHPTPGLDDEALHPIGSLDDLGLEIGQDAGQGAVKDRALIGAVGEQFPEKGKQTEQGRQQRETAVAILNVGGGDDAVQQQALRIDQNMPLLALDQLAGIEAVAVDASPPFSALFTL